jgi:hypothetical protein
MFRGLCGHFGKEGVFVFVGSAGCLVLGTCKKNNVIIILKLAFKF